MSELEQLGLAGVPMPLPKAEDFKPLRKWTVTITEERELEFEFDETEVEGEHRITLGLDPEPFDESSLAQALRMAGKLPTTTAFTKREINRALTEVAEELAWAYESEWSADDWNVDVHEITPTEAKSA